MLFLYRISIGLTRIEALLELSSLAIGSRGHDRSCENRSEDAFTIPKPIVFGIVAYCNNTVNALGCHEITLKVMSVHLHH